MRPAAAQHQLAALVAAGVHVALCTDNPVVSNTRLTREYELAGDLVDAASLDLIRQHTLAARFPMSNIIDVRTNINDVQFGHGRNAAVE